MAISDDKIRANRENAQKSTGPRTAEGKARSAQNARIHGLTAIHVVLSDEDVEAYEIFRTSMEQYWGPVGPYEELLVDQLVAYKWRISRIPRIEASIICRPQSLGSDLERMLARYSGLEPSDDPEPESGEMDLGRAFLDDPRSVLPDLLPRYEARLARRCRDIIAELEKRQTRRRKHTVTAPVDAIVASATAPGTDPGSDPDLPATDPKEGA